MRRGEASSDRAWAGDRGLSLRGLAGVVRSGVSRVGATLVIVLGTAAFVAVAAGVGVALLRHGR